MKRSYKVLTLILGSSLMVGCSGKSLSMQNYADKWFNEKPVKTEVSEKKTAKQNSSSYIEYEKTNKAIKSGTGADIAVSSTYKRDQKMKGKGILQKSLDTWMKEEWEPTFKGDKEQVKEDKKANKHFTMQHYVDKYSKYLKTKEDKLKKSGEEKPETHYEKIDKMIVIGK